MRHDKGTSVVTIRNCGFEAIVQHYSKMLTHDNNGGLTIHWTRSVLEQMNFVNRKATTAAKIEPLHFDGIKEQSISTTVFSYLLDIKAVVKVVKFPSELVFNWDHAGINIVVPGSKWTIE